MSTEPDKEIVELGIEADALLHEVRLAIGRAIPVLLKLKRAQFLASPRQVYVLKAILGTDSIEGAVNSSVRDILTATVHGTLYK